MEKFKAVLDLQSKHRSALGYGLVTLLTAGGEKIFSEVVFQCPCTATWNLPYGLVFLLVPALALFLLGYALSARTWRLLTGCCCGSARCSSWRRRAFVCAQLSATAALAPLTWVAVALLEGSFYQCAVSGSARLGPQLQLHYQATAYSLQPGGENAGDPESAQGSVSGQALGAMGRLRGARKKSVTFL